MTCVVVFVFQSQTKIAMCVTSPGKPGSSRWAEKAIRVPSGDHAGADMKPVVGVRFSLFAGVNVSSRTVTCVPPGPLPAGVKTFSGTPGASRSRKAILPGVPGQAACDAAGANSSDASTRAGARIR